MNHRLGLIGLLLSFFICFNAQAEDVKEWNFLVFINGVNNLDQFGKMNINQMEEVGSNDKMNILVQWGSLANPNVQRLRVEKDNDKSRVTSPILQNLGGADMGDWRELVRFVEWSNQNFPAKRTFVVVWNHGSGWRFMQNGVGVKDISHDDRTGHVITTEQLGLAMRTAAASIGKKIDIYASDACLMGMVEVADEMSTAVNYFVGSQDLEPGEGWPYAHFLRKWAPNADTMSPSQVAKLISKEFLAAYSGGVYGNQDVTMAAYDLTKIGNYKRAVKAFAGELAAMSNDDLAKVKKAASSSKSFYFSDYRDILDFANLVRSSKVQVDSFNALVSAHQEFVIANDQNQDSRTWGVSVWLPNTPNSFGSYWERYKGLSFQKSTDWGSFVKRMLNK